MQIIGQKSLQGVAMAFSYLFATCGEGEQDDWTAAYFKPVITGSVSQEKLTRLYILLFSSTNTKKPNFPFGFGDLVKSVADLERHRVIKSFPS